MVRLVRGGVVVLAAVVLVAGGSSVASADEVADEQSVDVSVEIPQVVVPGVLALSVAADSTSLTESGSTGAVRQFVGVLPDVTVTDTRAAGEVPEGATWSVVGSAAEFVSGGERVSADHFGWSPRLVEGTSDDVEVGGDVATVLDGERGLRDQELLAAGQGLALAGDETSWTASADLLFKVPVDTVPGRYTSTITLSLFE